MPRGPEIEQTEDKDGVFTFKLASWKHFAKFISRDMLEYNHYIWRGQADPTWKLESSLDRLAKRFGKKPSANLRRHHLRRFKKAARGRRGRSPRDLENENEWWALGQHYGLATPLLDWTTSPFVALYHAFRSPDPVSGNRMVFGLHAPTLVDSAKTKPGEEPKQGVPLPFSPDSDENPRLVNQAGNFIRMPDGIDLEGWVVREFRGTSGDSTLIKVKIPTTGRSECLTTLNRMNINHLSLFPDLYGSVIHANMEFGIPGYRGFA